MKKPSLAELRKIITDAKGKLKSDRGYIISDIHIPKMIKMIRGKLEQGERVEETVRSSINF